jgi:hypothetical protein
MAMRFLLPTIVGVLILLGIERLLHLENRGRKVLATTAFALAMIYGALRAGSNPDVRLVSFTIRVLDSLLAIGLWLWVSHRLREDAARRSKRELP